MLTFKTLTPANKKTLDHLRRRVINHWEYEGMARHAIAGVVASNYLLVAYENSVGVKGVYPLGVCLVEPFQEWRYIHYLVARFPGEGIGRALLEQIPDPVYLISTSDALGFYNACGFRISGDFHRRGKGRLPPTAPPVLKIQR